MAGDIRRLAIATRKGGAGKTTTAVNLAAGLALRGESVLLVDLDPQADASLHLGIDIDKVERTIYELLIGEQEDGASAILPTKVKGLNVIPSAPRLAGADLELAPVVGRENILSKLLKSVESDYTYILLDTSSAFGIVTLNGLLYCDEILAPVQTHYFSVTAVNRLVEIITIINETYGVDIKISGLIPTMVDKRSKISKSLIENIESIYGKNLIRPSVRVDTKLSEAPSKGKPIQLFASKSHGAFDYTMLTEDIVVM